MNPQALHDLNFGASLSPLKNAFHASAWHVRQYRITAKEYLESHGVSLRSLVNSLPSEKNETDVGGFYPFGHCGLMSVTVLPRYRVPDEAAGARLSCQAPCVRLGAGQKPVENVPVNGSITHAVGPSAQGLSCNGKGWFPVTRSRLHLHELSRNHPRPDLAFPIPATSEIDRKLVASRRR